MSISLNPYTGNFDLVGTGGGGGTVPANDVTVPSVLQPILGATLAQALAYLEIATRNYIHIQSTPSTTWVVNHNMETPTPTITVLDGSGAVGFGYDLNIIDANNLEILFSFPVDGQAFLSR